jgi:hypothetical protein
MRLIGALKAKFTLKISWKRVSECCLNNNSVNTEGTQIKKF